MPQRDGRRHLWMRGRWTDLALFDFGFLVVLAPLLALREYTPAIIVFVLLINYVHRHYTLALVYAAHTAHREHSFRSIVNTCPATS